MKQRKGIEWSRLDNASKFFPATCNDKDTKVFRLACELNEAVKPKILQQALNLTIESFPLYKSVLRRGVFWYYLESSDIHPVVKMESNQVCAPIYLRDRRNLLFRVFYYNNRISLEVFHALSDGTGAIWFIQTLVHHYLFLRHKNVFADKTPKLNYKASISQQTDNSFEKYYTGKDTAKLTDMNNEREAEARAYHIRGVRLDESRLKVIEGCMSVKAVLDEAHKYNTTLTIFITSLFIYSIYKEMPANRKNRPIVISVPINLRQFNESETARNFFSTMKIAYHFSEGSTELKDVIQIVSENFRKELTEERLNKQVNRFVSLEKNLFTRVLPLPLKDYILRIGIKIKDRGVTAALSNIGRISMPSEFDAYIRQFIVYISVRRPQITICTYGDRLTVSFASPFRETEIQRVFFEFLSQKKISIEITSNL